MKVRRMTKKKEVEFQLYELLKGIGMTYEVERKRWEFRRKKDLAP